jgi:hypothetical protein
MLRGMSLSLLILSVLLAPSVLSQSYPAPRELGPTNEYGAHLQHSLRLMRDSPPTHKRTVRVLFYGQSITAQPWTFTIADFLRSKYPNAELVVTNLALAGFQADVLYRPALIDIPGFYPDLLIFQDYFENKNAQTDYERMMQYARRQTTTDILVQTEHVNVPEDLSEPTDPTDPGSLPARALRNYVTIPEIANEYGAELCDVRTYWKKYLQDYNLSVPDLLADAIHPNAYGNFLFSELIKPYLRDDPSFSSNEWAGAEQEYIVGRDVNWEGDVLNLDFAGNRVDVIADASGTAEILVEIDGRKPSAWPELYHFTRSDLYPGTVWMQLLRIESERPLLEEDWSAKLLETSVTNGVPFGRFAVSGSKTGYDGEANTAERFVSRSGRVVFEPSDWQTFLQNGAVSPLNAGFEIHWRSLFTGRDSFIPPAARTNVENALTIAQGLANGQHHLRLTRTGPAPLSALRVFNPLARVQPARNTTLQVTSVSTAFDALDVTVSAWGRYVLESSDDCRHWEALTAPLEKTGFTVPLSEARVFIRARAID